MASTDIDFRLLTHVFHFTARPNSDGTMDLKRYDVAETATRLVTGAHASGTKVLLTVGGSNSNVAFRSATSGSNLSTFVANIMKAVSTYGYDGVDVDWETLDSADASKFTAFTNSLRAELDKRTPRGLLTAAVARSPKIIASLQDAFDQLNIMAYDGSLTDLGVLWHNAALYGTGSVDPVYRKELPSVDWRTRNFINAGTERRKLGIGVPFYGYVWEGVGVKTPMAAIGSNALTPQAADYNVLRDTVATGKVSRDGIAQVPYAILKQPDRFVSFDDEVSITRKAGYVRDERLGGIMVFELAAGYLGDAKPGERNPLLAAIWQELNAVHQ